MATKFGQTVVSEVVQATTANLNLDGTGAVVTLYTASAFGARIDKIKVSVAGTSSAALVHLFFREASVDTWRYVETIAIVTALTPSATQQPYNEEYLDPEGILLKSGAQLGVSTTVTQNTNVWISKGAEFAA
jgi:hypothetical protein